MRFIPEIHDWEFTRVFQEFLAITGTDAWKKRAKSIVLQVKQNKYLHSYLHQLHYLELVCAECIRSMERSGATPTRINSVEQYRLYAFVAMTVRVYQGLSSPAKKRLTGRLLGGLRDHIGLTPLQQEMTTAAHLMHREFDVEFLDLETGGGFDFLARRGDVELEVECKRVGLDLGRKITRRETLELHKYIEIAVSPVANRLQSGLFVRVTLPDRLSGSHSRRQELSNLIGRAVRTGVGIHDQPACQIDLADFDIKASPFGRGGEPDGAFANDARAFIDEKFRTHNRELYMSFSPQKRALVISLESAEKDAVLDRMFDELSDSAQRQFTKTRPGVLCVQFIDISNEQVAQLATDNRNPAGPSAILRKTSEFLNSADRRHIHAIAYRGGGDVRRTSNGVGLAAADTTSEDGNAYVIFNDNHPLANDRRYSVFSANRDGSPPPLIYRD